MTVVEKQRLDKVEEKLEALEKKVDQVLTALTGSNLSPDKGIVDIIKTLDKRVDSLEETKKKVWWIWIGTAIGSGLGLTKLAEWAGFIK